MDFISLVETCRIRAQMRCRSLALAESNCQVTQDELRTMNWSLFSGERGSQAVSDFTTLLLAAPDDDVYMACRISFADVLPHAFPAMCDTWRRLVLPARKKKACLLGLGKMALDEAAEWLRELSKMPMCCIGDPFVQVWLSDSVLGGLLLPST